MLESKKTVVLTGAGISTESGIPDFRSPGGIWSKFDPGIMTSSMLSEDPGEFFKRGKAMLSFLGDIEKSKPNRAHQILAGMEKDGFIDCTVTQNIDSLHQKAGSKNVYEVHGNLREGYCISCKAKVRFSLLAQKIREGEIPPLCSKCRGILRPGVVLFGDKLPDYYNEALEEVKKSDMLLVIGSSLETAPVSYLPALAGKYIIINKESTGRDSGASMVWHEKASTALEEIKRAMDEGINKKR